MGQAAANVDQRTHGRSFGKLAAMAMCVTIADQGGEPTEEQLAKAEAEAKTLGKVRVGTTANVLRKPGRFKQRKGGRG